jgi:uncharacterized protein YdaU (DUF1376 family)
LKLSAALRTSANAFLMSWASWTAWPCAETQIKGIVINYYKFNIGDYSAATRHLTMLEHGAYRLLLDVYYTTEKALPSDIKAAARKAGARSKEEMAAVEVVLTEFFVLTEEGWIQNRCESEIAVFQSKAEANRVIGKKGGRPKKVTQAVPDGNPEITQTVSEINPLKTLTTNQEPLTINHSVTEVTGVKPPMTPDEIIFGYGVPILTNAGTAEKQARSFLGGLRKAHGDDALVNALRECIRAKPLQPLEWLAKTMPPQGSASTKPNKQEALEARNRAIADEWATEQGAEIESV